MLTGVYLTPTATIFTDTSRHTRYAARLLNAICAPVKAVEAHLSLLQNLERFPTRKLPGQTTGPL